MVHEQRGDLNEPMLVRKIINFFLISEEFLFDIPYAPFVFQVTSVYSSASFSVPSHLEALLDDGHLSMPSV